MAVLNLTKTYSEYIHTPTIRNSANRSPLYAISPGEDDKIQELKELNRDPDWLKYCEFTYNSPTNTRRIIITDSYVVTQFYKPFIVSGKPYSEGCWKVRAVPDKDIKDFRSEMFENPTNHMTGNPLICIKRPWVLSNIEELILDETSLLSESIVNAGIPVDTIKKIYTSNNYGSLIKHTQNIITSLISMTIEQIKAQFPRLKGITIIPGLSKLMKSTDFRPLISSNIDDIYHNLLKLNKINPNNCLRLELIPKNSIDRGNIAVRTYYKFDKEVLSKFARTFEDELANDRKQSRENISKSEFETLLDSISAKSGDNVANMIYKLCNIGLSSEDKNDLYNMMTPQGVEKYIGGR